jgi:hypothetical protein
VLCSRPQASEDEIKKAFRKQALLYHPDKITQNAELLRSLGGPHPVSWRAVRPFPGWSWLASQEKGRISLPWRKIVCGRLTTHTQFLWILMSDRGTILTGTRFCEEVR